ncbi:MAG: hypothetical protein K6C14_00610 [Eubacterium sp.]|nr:hypothetical protein [Eubacterium sp.]
MLKTLERYERAEERTTAGRTGETIDPKLKTTPMMIPYEELPESEKDYYRNTSLEALKLIIKLGYKITREDGKLFID